MPASDQSDPNRPFTLALRSLRVLAFISIGFGLVMLFRFGFYNSLPQFRRGFKILATVVWLLPGVGFVLAAIMMKERQRWVVFVAMAAAGLQLVMALAIFAANFVFSPISPVPVVLSALWVAALVQLLLHLKQSLAALNLIEADSVHGFEMTMAALPIDQSSESVRGK